MQIYRSTKIAPNNPKGSMLQQASLHVMRQLGKRQSIIPRWSIFRSCSICNHQTVHSPLVFPVIFGFPHHWTRCSLPLYFLHLFAVSTHDCWFKKHCQEAWWHLMVYLFAHLNSILDHTLHSPLYSTVLHQNIILNHTPALFSYVFYSFPSVPPARQSRGRVTTSSRLEMVTRPDRGHSLRPWKMAASPAEMPRFRMILIDLIYIMM